MLRWLSVQFFSFPLAIGILCVGSLGAWADSPPLPQSPPSPQPSLPQSLQRQETVPALEADRQLWGEAGFQRDWRVLMRAVNHSLNYLRSPKSIKDYEVLAAQLTPLGITHDRVLRSVATFRHLLLTARSPQDLQRQVEATFEFYQASGTDGLGTVHFTGYFEPTYPASLRPTDRYRYPLYRRPPDLATWPQPHPSRLQLEGLNGLRGNQGPLKDLAFVWLDDRLAAYLIQVQGSARLALTDGTTMSVGYDGRTEYPYQSLGRMLVEAGKFPAEALTLPKVIEYFHQHPEDLDRYLPQNDRFVFFKETHGAPATGSLGVPVLPGRSIATDKTLMPPGALALIQLQLPYRQGSQGYQLRDIGHYVLDQDTGGAIRGAGRVDIFMGTGAEAGERAGRVNSSGALYYLLLKSPPPRG